ncbi:MAG: ABC transporter permease [Firmicutes bacterium]|nr:ABC transporter permease [Bacillota bacterium]
MYFIKNAWLTIKRNVGRNLLVAIIFIVIACACTVTLAIKTSANQLIQSYDSKYDIEASIQLNREAVMKDFEAGTDNLENNQKKLEQISSLSVDEIKNYGESDYVTSYYYTYEFQLNGSELEKASSEFTERRDKRQEDEDNQEADENEKKITQGDFTIKAYNSYDAMNDFISGNYKITDGEIDSDFTSQTCIIHEELATLNDIKVGDTITLVNPDNENLTYELKVTGIYQSSNEDMDGPFQMFSNSANTIITNQSVAEKVTNDDGELRTQITPTYLLKNKDVITNFEKEVSQKGLDENYQVTTNLDSIQNETKAISNLGNFANIFFIITFVIGGIVLFVINMIHIRERKYEIGVLRTIGMKKSQVALKFLCELFLISITSIMIGSGIGAMISVPTANQLLKQEINSSQNEQQQISENFGRGGKGMEMRNQNNTLKQITEIHAAVDISVLGKVLVIGIILTLVGGLAAIFNIARFSPLEILRERS